VLCKSFIFGWMKFTERLPAANKKNENKCSTEEILPGQKYYQKRSAEFLQSEIHHYALFMQDLIDGQSIRCSNF
jgi:hypothetical protein